jgi:uncharacterized protein YraI
MIILLIVGILFLGGAEQTQTSEDKGFPFTGIISANNVNVRAGASLNFEILCQLNKGDKVIVQGESYKWYKIKLPREARCFISKDYVYSSPSTSGVGESRKGGVYQGIVSADNVNIRAGRGTHYSILGQLNSGDLVTILEEYKGWFRIEPPRGLVGWVHSDFVEYSSPGEPPKEEITRESSPEEAERVEEVEKIKQQPPPIASGIIDDLGVVINRPGRQKLIRDDGKIFYLKSESIDLAKYVYYHVRVWGSIKKLPELRHPLIIVERIELLK